MATQSKVSSIATVNNVMQRYPLPPKKGAKKVEEKKITGFVVIEPKIPENESVESALNKATSWLNKSKIESKFSVGTLTTAKYNERVSVFDKMNSVVEKKSALNP